MSNEFGEEDGIIQIHRVMAHECGFASFLPGYIQLRPSEETGHPGQAVSLPTRCEGGSV